MKPKSLLILVAVLVVMCVGYFALNSYNESQKPDVTGQIIRVFDDPVENITKMAWRFEGESVSLVQTQGGWELENDKVFPVNVSAVEEMLTVLKNATTLRKLDNRGELSEYGLDSPLNSISVTTADGNEKVYLIGDFNNISKEYYLKMSGDEAVYGVADLLQLAYSKKLMDVVQMEEMPYFSGVNRVLITRGDEVIELTSTREGEVRQWFVVEDGVTSKLDEVGTNNLLFEIFQFPRSECIEYNAGDDELAGYMLNPPQVRVAIHYLSNEKDTVVEVQLGGVDAEVSYARLGGSRMVYTVEKKYVDIITGVDISSLK